MRYKVGNQVRVLPIVDMPEFSEAKIGKLAFIDDMRKYCNRIVSITKVREDDGVYQIAEDGGTFMWTDDMFDCKLKPTTKRIKSPQERFLETSYAECKADMEKWRERAINAERLLSALAAYAPKAEERLKKKKLTR